MDTLTRFFQENGADLWRLTIEHIGISALSVILE